MKTTYKIMKINWLIIVDSISTQIQIAIAWNTRKTQTRSFMYFSFLLFRFSSVLIYRNWEDKKRKRKITAWTLEMQVWSKWTRKCTHQFLISRNTFIFWTHWLTNLFSCCADKQRSYFCLVWHSTINALREMAHTRLCSFKTHLPN